MHAYATGPDLDRLIARARGDPARAEDDPPMTHGLRTAGCPSAERNLLTWPTGEASPVSAPGGVDSPLAQLRHSGRADDLKRRRKVRDEILGRDGKLSQSPSGKGRRQTLNRCLVRPAYKVDASFENELLAAVSRASSSEQDEKTEAIQSASGVRPLDFRDQIEVQPRLASIRLQTLLLFCVTL